MASSGCHQEIRDGRAVLVTSAEEVIDLVQGGQGTMTVPGCGTLVVNGHTVVIPKETIVILPASALTWQELFAHAPGLRDAMIERALDTFRAAAGRSVAHALAVVPVESASDARLLQIVEQAHAASADVAVVVHPSAASAAERDRRWTQWLELAMAVHADTRLLPVLPSPTGTR